MKPVARPDAVLFDLDGTLVDSVPDLAAAINAALGDCGLAAWPETRIRDWVGDGAAALVTRALTGGSDDGVDEPLRRRAFERFQHHYARGLAARTRVYPGVRETLACLVDNGVALGCVTNKPMRFTGPLLEALNLHHYFRAVVGGDSVTEKKPDPAPLLHALKMLDVLPANAVMVGDSANDVNAGRAAGCVVIAVTYGYNHGRDIRECGPDAVIDQLSELRTLLSKAA